MTRGQYYQRVMPIAAIIYVIVLALSGWNGTVAFVGAMVIAIIAVSGNWVAPRRKDKTGS